jgi:hypothetical protein
MTDRPTASGPSLHVNQNFGVTSGLTNASNTGAATG